MLEKHLAYMDAPASVAPCLHFIVHMKPCALTSCWALSLQAECTKQTGCFLGVWNEDIPVLLLKFRFKCVHSDIKVLLSDAFSSLWRPLVGVTPAKLLNGEKQACRVCVCGDSDFGPGRGACIYWQLVEQNRESWSGKHWFHSALLCA